MRSANKHLLQEAAQWTLVGATLFLGVYFFDDLKNLVDSTGRELRLTFAAVPRLGKKPSQASPARFA